MESWFQWHKIINPSNRVLNMLNIKYIFVGGGGFLIGNKTGIRRWVKFWIASIEHQLKFHLHNFVFISILSYYKMAATFIYIYKHLDIQPNIVRVRVLTDTVGDNWRLLTVAPICLA